MTHREEFRWPTNAQMARWADDFWVGTGFLPEDREAKAQWRLQHLYDDRGSEGIWEKKKYAVTGFADVRRR